MARFFLFVSFCTFPGLLLAQEPGQLPRGGEFPPPLDPVSRLLDTDQDGELSAEEIEKAAEILLTGWPDRRGNRAVVGWWMAGAVHL